MTGRKQRIFFDSSAWFSAIGSPAGGAGAILSYAIKDLIVIVITEKVIEEVARNLQKKMEPNMLLWFLEVLELPAIEFIDNPTPEEEARWCGTTVEKDCHMLAGALNGRADVLISHDKKDIVNEKVKHSYPLTVMTPGDFLKKWAQK